MRRSREAAAAAEAPAPCPVPVPGPTAGHSPLELSPQQLLALQDGHVQLAPFLLHVQRVVPEGHLQLPRHHGALRTGGLVRPASRGPGGQRSGWGGDWDQWAGGSPGRGCHVSAADAGGKASRKQKWERHRTASAPSTKQTVRKDCPGILQDPPPSTLGPPKLRAWPPRGPAHLQGLEDGFGAVLVGLLGWELCLLELQELAPEDLPKRGQLQGGSHGGQPWRGSCRGAAQTPDPMRSAVGHKPGPRSPSSPLPAGCQPSLTTSHGCLHTSARLGGNSGNPPPHFPWHAEPAGRKGPGGEARVCRG